MNKYHIYLIDGKRLKTLSKRDANSAMDAFIQHISPNVEFLAVTAKREEATVLIKYNTEGKEEYAHYFIEEY